MGEDYVLVVDDDEMLLSLLVRMMKHLGYSCKTAEDGQTAYALALEIRPCLVVTDIVMPGMHGFSLIAELNNHPLTEGIPILVISGLVDGSQQMMRLPNVIGMMHKENLTLTAIRQMLERAGITNPPRL